MRHCCQFKPDDVYYLSENDAIFKIRMLYVGFCPICNKPVAELQKIRFDGVIEKESFAGIKANEIMIKLQNEIKSSWQNLNYLKVKQAPTGWKYGENKSVKIKGQEKVRQYQCDFFGNKELIKTI